MFVDQPSEEWYVFDPCKRLTMSSSLHSAVSSPAANPRLHHHPSQEGRATEKHNTTVGIQKVLTQRKLDSLLWSYYWHSIWSGGLFQFIKKLGISMISTACQNFTYFCLIGFCFFMANHHWCSYSNNLGFFVWSHRVSSLCMVLCVCLCV